MLKELFCYPSQIPLGSTLMEDIYSEDNNLILKKGTRITKRVHGTLLRYVKPIKIALKMNDEDVVETRAEDKAFSLSSEIKEQTKQGVEYIYNNPNSQDVLVTASDVSNSLLDLIENSSDTSISLKNIKISDDYTFKHCVDVATMAILLGKYLEVDDDILENIALAGVLHDLGKTKVPEEILNKPGKLSSEEFDVIKSHPVFGYNLVSSSSQLSDEVKSGILEHHENMDGSGYPNGLKGNQISLIGKLLSIVDVYDALVTKRPYRADKIEPATAIEMMLSMNNKFDISLLSAFLNCVVIYPIGTKLLLSDNKVYEVVAQNVGYPTRPVVKDVNTGEQFDLCRDIRCLNLVIVSSTK